MSKYWKLLAEYDEEGVTFTPCLGTVSGAKSPYSPVENAKLKGLRAFVNRDGATTLINAVQFKLDCATFSPNSLECGVQGSGLQTVPAMQSKSTDWEFDQPVKAGVPIIIEARNITGDTPVGVGALLYGFFDNAGGGGGGNGRTGG